MKSTLCIILLRVEAIVLGELRNLQDPSTTDPFQDLGRYRYGYSRKFDGEDTYKKLKVKGRYYNEDYYYGKKNGGRRHAERRRTWSQIQ